jgi:hypothetical protein
MRRLKCLVVIGALTIAVSAAAAGPAAAAKGGNNDTAKQCQKGGWKTLASQTGEPFKNQGDCVNDGAHGLGAGPPSAGQTACDHLTQSEFTPLQDDTLWQCEYPVPPNPAGPLSALQDACASDSGRPGSRVAFQEVRGGEVIATCLI